MMTGAGDTLLGRPTPVPDTYSPDILRAIPRRVGREALGLYGKEPFFGTDLWHAYELSWLDRGGRPVVRVGRFSVPARSPNMVESKSFKLYLNSLNSTRFASEEAVRDTLVADIGAIAGAGVGLDLLAVDHPSLAGSHVPGDCLDGLEFEPAGGEPRTDLLRVETGNVVEAEVFSHLLRSLCPVTGQPDWATLWLHYRGAAIQRASLLRYIVSYREHREFHEQCVERVFRDVHDRSAPEFLHVQAFYTRRGGLDINPFRSTDPAAMPLPRLARQ
jgi:7-cyano-7-deazaguanine reductase